MHGLFDDVAPYQKQYCSLETDSAEADPNVWVDFDIADGVRPWCDPEGAFFAPPDDREYTSVDIPTFQIDDMPVQPFVRDFSLAEDQVDRARLAMSFFLVLAVRTEDETDGSDARLFSRAEATWQFRGDGQIDATGKWSTHYTDPADPPNKGSDRFAELVPGQLLPPDIVWYGLTMDSKALDLDGKWFEVNQ